MDGSSGWPETILRGTIECKACRRTSVIRLDLGHIRCIDCIEQSPERGVDLAPLRRAWRFDLQQGCEASIVQSGHDAICARGRIFVDTHADELCWPAVEIVSIDGAVAQ